MRVKYVAPCFDASGYGEAARNHILALNEVGVKVDVKPLSFEKFQTNTGVNGLKIKEMVSENNSANIQIIHATPENYKHFYDSKKYNIAYTVWETDRLPPEWVPLLNQMQELWVPCTHNLKCFKDSGVNIPIHVMPHPLKKDKKEYKEKCIGNLDKDDFVFYSIFQWTERKNPIALLKAYLTEFKENEKVALLLKTYIINPGDPKEVLKLKEVIREIKAKLYLKTFPKIILISKLLSKDEIEAVHNQSSCYVSLQRSEGFGMPIAEAMLYGKPVITTTYGGPEDFINKKTGYPVNYLMTPCYNMPWSKYTGDMLWCEADVVDAKKQMREVFNNKEKAKEKGLVGQKEILTNFSWESIGHKMKNRLEEIYKDI